MKRFVVIVLDGLGIGAMDDAMTARPGDKKANTLRGILRDHPDMRLSDLERLGLVNAYGAKGNRMKTWEDANSGKSELMHLGADTFMGHQEIMGTFPQKPGVHPFQEKVDAVAGHFKEQGHKVEVIERGRLRYVLYDDSMTVADNLKVDLGMCYNVTAPLGYISFEKEYEIGRLVREVVTVGHVIVFGGTGNSMEDLWNVEETKDHIFIGIVSAKSRSYGQGYQRLRLGYRVDKNVQAPTTLTDARTPVTLIGKVVDIVANDKETGISCVPTEVCMKHTIHAFRHMETGFTYTNMQETDLAGHSQSSSVYRQILEAADRGTGELFPLLTEEDVLLVMADHGNDSDIGYSKHTRGCAPLLVYRKGVAEKRLGIRKSPPDVGANVCDYFGVKVPWNGISFMGCPED